MKEFFDSFKTGIMILIIAYLILALVCNFSGSNSFYVEQIQKLENPLNALIQLAYAGLTYTLLTITFKVFVDNIIKGVDQNNKKKVLKNAVVAAIIVALVVTASYYMKEYRLLHKTIVKLMFAVLTIEAIGFVIRKIVENTVYNSKLKEKNGE